MIKKEFILKKIAKILLHTICWTVVLFSYTYFFGYDTENIEFAFSFSLFLMPVTIGTTYVGTTGLTYYNIVKGSGTSIYYGSPSPTAYPTSSPGAEYIQQ